MLTYESDRFRDTELELKTGHFYRGRSVGGEETCHQLPGLDVCFDIGHAPMSSTTVGRVFLSHGHADHAGGIPRHIFRRSGWGLDPAQYFVPDFLLDGVYDLLRAMRKMGCGARSPDLISVREGDQIRLTDDRYLVPFRVYHRIPCYGYMIYQRRRKLKSEYASLSGPDIGKLRKSGVDVTEEVDFPDVAYCGDTRIDVVRDVPDLRKVRFLILECTMVDDTVSVHDTRKAGHVHLDEIVERQADFDNEIVLMSHFSTRYSSGQVRDALRRVCLPEKFVGLLPSERR